jgi:hypothetical protein
MPGGSNGPPNFTGSPFVQPTRTLAQLRLSVIRRLGFSAMANNPPPGLNELINEFLQDAYDQLYKRLPQLRTLRWWPISIIQGERFYDTPYSGAYTGNNTGIAITSGSPDSLTRTEGSWIDDGYTTGDEIRIFGSDSNDGIHTVGASVTALTMNLSTSLTVTAEAAGNPITVSATGFRYMDNRHIEEAWIKDGTTWYELTDGINPGLFNQTNQDMPHNYEVREYFEFWPEPDQAYEAYFKAHFGMTPLQVDTDQPSMDDSPIFLMALANAKAHYGQPDASTYYRQLQVDLGQLNAGTFGTKKYIPGEKPETPMSKPKATWR